MPAPPLGLTTLGRVIRVIDGDTIVVRARDTEVVIRLLDCWAPELPTPEGVAARNLMRELLPVASRVTIHVPTVEGGKLSDLLTFGRVLAHVWRRGDAVSISERMCSAGMASKEKPK